MLKVKHERTCDCVVAGFRVHKDGNGVGSLLLGLYDDDGDAAPRRRRRAAMAAKLRTELLAEVEPLRKNALDGPSVARLGRGDGRGRRERAAHAGRPEPLERDQGHVVGAAAHRAGRARSSTRG